MMMHGLADFKYYCGDVGLAGSVLLKLNIGNED